MKNKMVFDRTSYMSKYWKTYYEDNKEKLGRYSRKYYIDNKSKINIQNRARYLKNKGGILYEWFIGWIKARFMTESVVFTKEDLDYIKDNFTWLDEQYINSQFTYRL